MPHSDRPVYRVPSDGLAYSARDADFDALFRLDLDPECRDNRFSNRAEETQSVIRQLARAMEDLAVPDEHFERLGLER